MSIAIVKYNAGNIRSVLNALARLGVEATLSDDPNVLRQADKVLFPGRERPAMPWPICASMDWTR